MGNEFGNFRDKIYLGLKVYLVAVDCKFVYFLDIFVNLVDFSPIQGYVDQSKKFYILTSVVVGLLLVLVYFGVFIELVVEL